MCKLIEKGLVGLAPRRKAAGYTQETFADALGIDRARLGMWEIGQAWPSAAWLPKMADLLCCTIDDLYERPEAQEDRRAIRESPLQNGTDGTHDTMDDGVRE